MPAKKKVFVSYNYDTDKQYKNLLLAWNKSSLFDFKMQDHSADVSVQSHNASIIKRIISAKIKKGNYFIVLVGKSTRKCQWVKWEIEKAKALNKKIIAVKLDRRHKAPDELYGAGAIWAYAFKLNSISKAIERAESR